jgi:hypothetical protein
MHRTLKQETAQLAASNRRAQQRAFDRFCEECAVGGICHSWFAAGHYFLRAGEEERLPVKSG